MGQLEDYRDECVHGLAWEARELTRAASSNQWRSTSEEKRHLDRRMLEEEPSDSAFNYNAIRRAAEVHRRVRKYARSIIKPGMKMLDIANAIEDGTRTLVEAEGFKSGIGFPTGLNVNHCAAHWSPNPGDTTILHDGSMLKVDFGVHVNGRIVDSAFTLDFNTGYGKLMDAVQDATNTGVREAGIDVRVRDIGAAVQEVMESYEVEINGKTLPVKTIRNLTGHNITPYLIHGGKSVPITGSSYETDKMEEGEYFAIETFGTTGRGYVHDEGECSHYARAPDVQQPVRLPRARAVLNLIKNEFGTLPFCPRYIERLGEENFMPSLRHLAREGLLQDYPPLCDEPGSMTAQFEHTILLRPTCKEIVSRGDDY